MKAERAKSKAKKPAKPKSKDTAVQNRIREMRFFANEMTQQELAQRVGVSRQTIVAIESAKYSPTLELAFKIAAVFDKPIGDVFAYKAEDAGNERSDD